MKIGSAPHCWYCDGVLTQRPLALVHTVSVLVGVHWHVRGSTHLSVVVLAVFKLVVTLT